MLETKRLVLRYFEMTDCEDVTKFCQDEMMTKYLPLPSPYHLSDAESWISGQKERREKGTTYDFAIIDKETNKLIGSISLMINKSNNFAEIGYWLAPAHWRKGLTTEACKKIIEFAFDNLKLHKVFAKHYIENPASGKVMEKSGLHYVATLQDHALKDGKYHDVKLYELINKNN
ncbi:MAG: GNAT family N-acetyltransferase [Candidatus Caccovivens sp.]